MGWGYTPPGGGGGEPGPQGPPGTMAWDPITTVTADGSTVTTAAAGAAYIVPHTSGENRAIFDFTALLDSPGVPCLVAGQSKQEADSSKTTYGPTAYVEVDLPAWITDVGVLVGSITVTDFSGSPVDLVFTSPAVTVTLDADYGTAVGVVSEIVSQINAVEPVSVVQTPFVVHHSTAESPYYAGLRTTATGNAVSFVFNAGASTASELTTWFSDTDHYTDGVTAYGVGLHGMNVGNGDKSVRPATHLWTDDREMEYVHASIVVSLDGETITAEHYKFRPESISYSPTDTGDWPEHDFNDTPANFSLADALNILAARPSLLPATADGDFLISDGTDWTVTNFTTWWAGVRQTQMNGTGNFYYANNTGDPVSGSVSLSWAYRGHHLTVDDTTTLSFAAAPGGSVFLEMSVAITGNETVNLPSAIWPSGSAPTYGGTTSVFRFWSYDGGTTVYGELVGTGFA